MGMKPKMPKVQDPVRMPIEDDERAKAAKRRAQAALQAQGGRESTNLADTDLTSNLGK